MSLGHQPPRMPCSLTLALWTLLPPSLSHRKLKVEVSGHLGIRVLRQGGRAGGASNGLRVEGEQMKGHRGRGTGRSTWLRLQGPTSSFLQAAGCSLPSAVPPLQPPECLPFTLSRSLTLVPAFTHALPLTGGLPMNPLALPCPVTACLSGFCPKSRSVKPALTVPLSQSGWCPPGPPRLPAQEPTSPSPASLSLRVMAACAGRLLTQTGPLQKQSFHLMAGVLPAPSTEPALELLIEACRRQKE